MVNTFDALSSSDFKLPDFVFASGGNAPHSFLLGFDKVFTNAGHNPTDRQAGSMWAISGLPCRGLPLRF